MKKTVLNSLNRIGSKQFKSLLLRQVMNFLTNTAVNLEFNPMAFVENLEYMGVGMVVIFAIIGVIILATKLVNFLFSE